MCELAGVESGDFDNVWGELPATSGKRPHRPGHLPTPRIERVRQRQMLGMFEGLRCHFTVGIKFGVESALLSLRPLLRAPQLAWEG